jgi:hypothetical protein
LVLDGKPMFAYAFSNQDGFLYPLQNKYKTRIAATDPLAPGKRSVVFDFAYDGGGMGKGGTGTLVSMARRLPRVVSSSPSRSVFHSTRVSMSARTPGRR